MSDSVKSPKETISEHFQGLIAKHDQAWKQCEECLVRIAQQGINRKAPGLSESQKEELQDEAIMGLYRNLDKLKDARHLVNLLRQIAANKTIDLLRSNKFKNVLSIQAIEDEQEAENENKARLPYGMTNTETAADSAKRTERHALLEEALDLVGELCKTMLVDKHVEDLTDQMIASKFNFSSISTMRYQLKKCEEAWKKIFFRIMEAESEKELLAL